MAKKFSNKVDRLEQSTEKLSEGRDKDIEVDAKDGENENRNKDTDRKERVVENGLQECLIVLDRLTYITFFCFGFPLVSMLLYMAIESDRKWQSL